MNLAIKKTGESGHGKKKQLILRFGAKKTNHHHHHGHQTNSQMVVGSEKLPSPAKITKKPPSSGRCNRVQTIQAIILILVECLSLAVLVITGWASSLTRAEHLFEYNPTFGWILFMLSLFDFLMVMWSLFVVVAENDSISQYSETGFYLVIISFNDFLALSYLFFIQFPVKRMTELFTTTATSLPSSLSASTMVFRLPWSSSGSTATSNKFSTVSKSYTITIPLAIYLLPLFRITLIMIFIYYFNHDLSKTPWNDNNSKVSGLKSNAAGPTAAATATAIGGGPTERGRTGEKTILNGTNNNQSNTTDRHPPPPSASKFVSMFSNEGAYRHHQLYRFSQSHNHQRSSQIQHSQQQQQHRQSQKSNNNNNKQLISSRFKKSQSTVRIGGGRGGGGGGGFEKSVFQKTRSAVAAVVVVQKRPETITEV